LRVTVWHAGRKPPFSEAFLVGRVGHG